MTEKNILWLITDQQTASAMSCAGNPYLKTPAMDRLAARGVRFSRAYCSHPLCTPSRASMFTGRWPHQVNATMNEGKFFWGHDIPRESLIGHTISQHGHRCVYAGKDMPPTDGSRDFELLCGWGDEQTADHLVSFLKEPHDKPFFAVGAFLNPHNICEWADGRALPEGSPGEDPPPHHLPPLPANFEVPPYEPQIIRSIQKSEGRAYKARDNTPDEWRRYIWAYYRMTEMVDAHIGRVLDALEAANLDDNTLVIFTSDHGDGCAAHRWNQKQVLYQESIHVPLIIAGPGFDQDRVDDEHLVSIGLDLMPTICAAAGATAAADLTGQDLHALGSSHGATTWRDSVVVQTSFSSQSFDPRRNRGRCMLFNDGWKYTVYEWGKHREALTNLHDDPGEMVNLAICQTYHERLQSARDALHAWTQETGDTFRVPTYDEPTAADRMR